VTELDWLLERLTMSVPGVRYAVILSPDGFPLGRSPSVTEDVAGHLAALAAGVQGLAGGAALRFAQGEVTSTIIEMQHALLFITPAGRGTCLALLAESTVDAGQVAYEMAVLIKRVGLHMIVDPRSPAQRPLVR
jgi:predicted regulator of Ras-like GTPase activity (Roadblock/LC7/MglB family)